MFKLVKYKEESPEIIVFDVKDFKPSDFNLIEVKEITLDELKKEYALTPMISLNDLILRTIRPKERTVSHVLSECGIECFTALLREYLLITELKASKLSSSQRKMVIDRYNYILSLTTEKDNTNEESVNND
jgi:hypothetical protein